MIGDETWQTIGTTLKQTHGNQTQSESTKARELSGEEKKNPVLVVAKHY
jgi:hypothetical protein